MLDSLMVFSNTQKAISAVNTPVHEDDVFLALSSSESCRVQTRFRQSQNLKCRQSEAGAVEQKNTGSHLKIIAFLCKTNCLGCNLRHHWVNRNNSLPLIFLQIWSWTDLQIQFGTSPMQQRPQDLSMEYGFAPLSKQFAQLWLPETNCQGQLGDPAAGLKALYLLFLWKKICSQIWLFILGAAGYVLKIVFFFRPLFTKQALFKPC